MFEETKGKLKWLGANLKAQQKIDLASASGVSMPTLYKYLQGRISMFDVAEKIVTEGYKIKEKEE